LQYTKTIVHAHSLPISLSYCRPRISKQHVVRMHSCIDCGTVCSFFGMAVLENMFLYLFFFEVIKLVLRIRRKELQNVRISMRIELWFPMKIWWYFGINNNRQLLTCFVHPVFSVPTVNTRQQLLSFEQIGFNTKTKSDLLTLIVYTNAIPNLILNLQHFAILVLLCQFMA
jgi:hypothetical protein